MLPGRLERRLDDVFDGAPNPDGAAWLTARLERDDYTLVVSILRDKDADAMLASLARAGRRLIATSSSNTRALPAAELATMARRHFAHVEVVAPPDVALARAQKHGPVLVTGSLYLLADLEAMARNDA